MYTVKINHECSCFKKSDYKAEQPFDKQQDAYQYAHILSELMNEEFCSAHIFDAHITPEKDFIISVTENPNAGSCSTGSCGSCGCD